MFGKPQLSPELLMALGGGIMSGQNLGQGLGQGFQNASNIMTIQKKEREVKEVENKTRSWLQKEFPEVDFSQAPPDMMKLYAEQAFKQRFSKPTAEFKELQDGTYGVWDGSKFNPLGSAPKQADLPAIADEYNFAKSQGFKGSFEEYQTYKAGLNKSGFMIEQGPDGQLRVVQGNVDTSKTPKLTEAEGRNAGFLKRAITAEKELSALETEGTSMWNKAAGNLPMGAGNYLVTEGAQKFNQAKRNFINAVLRRESGAVISESEFENANQQYFPQPGDSEAVIAQKRKNREDAIAGFEMGSGPAATRVKEMDTPSQNGVIDYKEYFK